jgi:ABC-2 type transport system ATP-binding protein
LELVQNQVAEEEISAVISTHLTEDLDEIADYILVLENGRQKMFMDREEMVDRFGEIGLRELLKEDVVHMEQEH